MEKLQLHFATECNQIIGIGIYQGRKKKLFANG